MVKSEIKNMDGVPEYTYVYIGGYGRSGSTILDILLSNHCEIVGTGELTNLFKEASEILNEDSKYDQDVRVFWRKVLAHNEGQDRRLNFIEKGKLTKKVERLFGTKKPNHVRDYKTIWCEILHNIHNISGKSIILDSSKHSRLSWNRSLLLKRDCSFKLKVIHLVRDPRAVMWSIQRGSNVKLEEGEEPKQIGGIWRGLVGWTIANLGAEYTKLHLSQEDYLLVRYEDIVTKPEESLQQIGRFLGIQVNGVITKLHQEGTLDPGLGISGNRLRRTKTIKLKYDDEWETKLSWFWHCLSQLTWPLKRRYGYHKNTNKWNRRKSNG